MEKIVGITKMDKISPYPKNVGIIINNGNGSTAEEFYWLLNKVKVKLSEPLLPEFWISPICIL